MKKLVLVLTLAAFALTGTAIAQVDPAWQNNIGIYTDEGGGEVCANLSPDTPLNLYLVLTKCTATEILGWEVKMSSENLTELDFAVRGDHVDAGTRAGEHIVGLPAPVPVANGTIVLADIQVMVNSFLNNPTLPSSMYLDNVYFHLLDDPVPAYLDGAAEGVAANPATIDGHEGGPVFFLNNGCEPVAVEESTWGSVKGLFR